jgi:heavy metal sensor kinase
VSRLPIRLRLTLAFALAMALVLAVVGLLLYARLGASLEEQIDDRLEARALALTDAVRDGTSFVLATDGLPDEELAQLVRPDGTIVEAIPSSPTVLDAAELEGASDGPILVSVDEADALDGEPARLRITEVAIAGERLYVVAGASLEDRQEALDGLLAQLLVVAPLALLLTALAGYLLAGAALRPVEAMRVQAAEVTSEQPGRRLPLPGANDEIRRLGTTLNEMLGRLEAGIQRERRFVADASHELRTPLAVLRTELELATRRPRTAAELELALRSAGDEVERLVRLAEDLLVLARADEGKLPLRLERLDARELLDAVAGRHATRAQTNGRTLVVADDVEVTVLGDRLRLEQAVGNLVDNALRHGAGPVLLDAVSDDGAVELSVHDDGAGLSAEFLPHAFERFSRSDSARSGAGAGLGLAIVDAVARAHGGSAVARNDAAGGFSVTIVLPAQSE